MKSPFTGKDMTIQKDWRILSFRKEKFKVCFHAYKCDDTGEQFEDEQLAELNYQQLQNQYRAKYSIPFPAEIKSIREKYELSAAKMSDVLGFGANSYRNYEAGEIPSESNARLIQLAADPHEFRKLISLSKAIDGKLLDKTNTRIEKILLELKDEKVKIAIENYLFVEKQANTLTGFVKPNLDKFAEMVLFFSKELKPMKTKLNKLLFYADFSHFKQTGFSISGVSYKAIQMGPVPNNFQSLYEYIANNELIDIVNIPYTDEIIGEQFLPSVGKQFDSSLFSDVEIKILRYVCDKFRNASTQEMINISHQETAWIDNENTKKTIDYVFAFDLK
ncbi:MAG: DUF4065 domain-containing protein [Paludibacter sp.]|nr:DUF4065 domain-containing protein [Paludibacter sp.]